MENTSLTKLFLIQMGKGLFLVTSSFVVGFFGYFFVNKHKFALCNQEKDNERQFNKDPKETLDDSSNDIPYEIMLKIIKKIKNKMIILLANLYDKTVLLNITEDLKKNKRPQTKDDNILIETISSGEIARVDDSVDKKGVNLNTNLKNNQKVHQTNQMFNSKLDNHF